jgi:GAF domain-containing protein
VYISYIEERDFTDEESALLGDIVRRISGYIESRHLFEQTQAALAEMEATQRRYLQWAWTEYPQTAKTTSYETERPGAAPLGDAVLPEVQQAVERQSATVLTSPSPLRQAQDVASSGHGDGAKGPALSKAEGESHSALVAPIALRGQVIGALGIHDEDGARQWTDAEIALVEAVAERMALTAENLRLFEESQRRAARERLTREITDKMRRAADMDALMRIAAQELAQALGISHAAVELDTDLQES